MKGIHNVDHQPKLAFHVESVWCHLPNTFHSDLAVCFVPQVFFSFLLEYQLLEKPTDSFFTSPSLLAFSIRVWDLFSSFSSNEVNVKEHGILTPSWGRSSEYFLLPVTVQRIKPPCHKRDKHMAEIFRGTCLTVVLFFRTATAKGSCLLLSSLWHWSISPMAASQISLYSWYPLTEVGTENSHSMSAMVYAVQHATHGL